MFDVSEVMGHKPYWTLQALTHVGRINGGFVFHCNVGPSQTTGQLGNLTRVLDPLEVRLFVWQQEWGKEC